MARGFVTSAGMRRRKGVAARQKKSRSALVAKRRGATASDVSYASYVPGIRRPDFGFPDKAVTRVRYADVFDLSGAAGAIGLNQFRMNSCNDPDLTGVGHQPMWYDQWCNAAGSAPYSRYRVIGSKITARFALSTAPSVVATNVAPILVGIQCEANSSLTAAGQSSLMESNNSNWTILQDKSGGNNVVTVSNTYSPTRDLGLDRGDDTISAAYNANPSQQFYAYVFKVDSTGSSTVKAYVEIEYLVEFFQRNEVNQS